MPQRLRGRYHEPHPYWDASTQAPGERLRVEHLKDRYAVGAGTLREAITRLVSDALVLAPMATSNAYVVKAMSTPAPLVRKY